MSLAVGKFLTRATNDTPIPKNKDVSTLGKTVTATLARVITGLAVNGGGCTSIRNRVQAVTARTTVVHRQLVQSVSHSDRTCSHIFTTFGLPGRARRRGTRHDQIVRSTAGRTTVIPVRITRRVTSIVRAVVCITRGKGQGTIASTYITVVATHAYILKTLLGIHVGLASVGSRTFIGQVSRGTSFLRSRTVQVRGGLLS